jgi:hypothetical protein
MYDIDEPKRVPEKLHLHTSARKSEIIMNVVAGGSGS